MGAFARSDAANASQEADILPRTSQWALKNHKPVSLKMRYFHGSDGHAKWYAEILVLKRRFTNPRSANTGRGARKQASDMACWWILNGAQLENAGLLSSVCFSAFLIRQLNLT
jgi:hypothetical protein